jgi:hypothetical protein
MSENHPNTNYCYSISVEDLFYSVDNHLICKKANLKGVIGNNSIGERKFNLAFTIDYFCFHSKYSDLFQSITFNYTEEDIFLLAQCMGYYRTSKYIDKETDEYFRNRIKEFLSDMYIPTEKDKYIIWSLCSEAIYRNLELDQKNVKTIVQAGLFRKFMCVVLSTFSDKLPHDEE